MDGIREQVNLGLEVRDVYRARIAEQLARGTIRPLVVPYSLLGTFILPVLYFSIPHVKRPWLYNARFALMAFIVAFNIQEIWSHYSVNFAASYAIGLCQSWGIIWAATLLIWMRPQFEAERVEKRPRKQAAAANGGLKGSNGHAVRSTGTTEEGSEEAHAAPDEDIAKNLKTYEYYWQAYPAEAPFLTRLDWAFDLVVSFRGTGWNWCIPVLPRFEKPEKPLSGELVKLNSLPVSTQYGYWRATTRKDFLLSRLRIMILDFIAMDFCSVVMVKDPYFVLGPNNHPLPSILAALPSWALPIWRNGITLLGITATLDMIFNLTQVLVYFLLGPLLGTRCELWHYPSITGSFNNVLDKGLAGFWGAWWHQYFRTAFSAPGAFILEHGVISNRKAPSTRAIAGLLAFVQSGFLHASGSFTEVGPSLPWMPPLFFLASWVGIVLQEGTCGVFDGQIKRLPRWVRRTGNFVYVALWMHFTVWPFLDDLARSGLWLFEPVPFSPLRAMGAGKPGDAFWRWDGPYWPFWYVGKHWWDSGIAL